MMCVCLGWCTICYTEAQDKARADSLLRVLQDESLPPRERSFLLGEIAAAHPDMGMALLYARQSLEIAETLGDPQIKAEALEEVGYADRTMGNNTAAIKAALEALHLYDSLQLEKAQGAVYAQLADDYAVNGELEVAIQYLKKSIGIYEKYHDEQRLAIAILNLGETYRLMGKTDSAIVYLQQAILRNKLIQDEQLQGYSLGNLGMAYADQGALRKSTLFLDSAITYVEALGDAYATSIYMAALGEVYQQAGRWRQAERKILEALAMADSFSLKPQIRDISLQLARGYEQAKQYRAALRFQKQFQVYQDSLVNKESIQQIEKLRTAYEIEKREASINLLHIRNADQRRFSLYLLSGVTLLLLLLTLLYRAHRRVKRTNILLAAQKDEIAHREAEKGWLLNELNHRVKNNFQMISSLLNLQSLQVTEHPAREAIEAGRLRVEALSLVHRKLYQEGGKTHVPMYAYMEELVAELFFAHHARFQPIMHIEKITLPMEQAIPLALVLNELVTNALKYAFAKQKQPALKITLSCDDDTLGLYVADNGCGFDRHLVSERKSFGIKLVHALAEQLNGVLILDTHSGTHWSLQIKQLRSM